MEQVSLNEMDNSGVSSDLNFLFDLIVAQMKFNLTNKLKCHDPVVMICLFLSNHKNWFLKGILSSM